MTKAPFNKAANDIEIPSALIKIVEAVEIPAVNEGVVASVLVREGDIVAVGDLLAQVDDTQAQLRSNQAEVEAEISSREAKNDVLPRLARKTHELAVTELKRGHDVNKGFPNSVSQRDLNILQLTVDKAELEMEQARHDMKISGLNDKLKQAQLQLTRNEVARYAIRAPLPGMIVHVDKRKGEWVSAGDLVVRVVRVDRVRAEGFVAAREAAFGLINRRATIRVALPEAAEKTVPGKIVFVSPEANPVDGRVRIWAEFDNQDLSLRPGLRGTVRVSLGETPANTTAKKPESPIGS